ncbi:golgin subfamily A member 2 isoform X2 [Bacillus rossius redtenbacheri]|uniref:golgin subfamily A member 2 isoform X2 n=1 Tax=Bacillus rossius redtenbacheri TaxID=93214 RepID=UPI002FDEF1A9
MADMSKAEKLAAARRKLKEFQQKTKENSTHPVRDVDKKESNVTASPRDEITMGGNSVFDSGPTLENSVLKEHVDTIQDLSSMNHVNVTEESLMPFSSPVEVFPSTLTTENSINANDYTSNGREIVAESKPPDFHPEKTELESKLVFPEQEDSTQSNFFEQYMPSGTDVSPDNPPSNMFVANNFFDSVSNFPSLDVVPQSPAETGEETQSVAADGTREAAAPEGADVLPNGDHAESRDGAERPGGAEALASHGRSSTESLRQLSHQISDLIGESADAAPPGGEPLELERRNQELAASLAAERQTSEQLRQQLREHSRASQLQLEADELRTQCDVRLAREVGPLQEQLQLHVQTLGLLVGEKTELQAALGQSQLTAKQKAAECEELQGRLRSLGQLEKELALVSEGSKQLERANADLRLELDRARAEQGLLRRRGEEAEEEAGELQRRLQAKSSECAALREECREKQSQLALTQLRVQQLSTPDSPETSSQLETLHRRNVSLEGQLAELQQVVRAAAAERDQASLQYQQYVQQLNSQLHSIAAKLEAATAESEQLRAREQGLVRHVSELEKQLQLQSQSQRTPEATRQLEQRLEALEGEKRQLALALDAQEREMAALREELEERGGRLEELNLWVEKLQSGQPDRDRLLAAMESDKVAAARAVTQNQQLKQQLEELQEGFVRMSNNKLELTDKLQYEQHVSKELGERLAQQESELDELRKAVEGRDRRIASLEQSSRELSTQVLQNHQIADRMRHYEAQGHFSDMLQQELTQAKERIEKLAAQNSELQALLAQRDARPGETASGALEGDGRRDAMLESLSASVSQLELERNQLLEQLREKSVASADNPEVADSEDLKKRYETMKQAMEQLEDRFANKMRDVAELSDEKQRLEHLVLQLQGETETIGEYIALYQVQRSVLRQRAREKDEQLTRLAEDREELRAKLDSLNGLVRQLLSHKEHRVLNETPSVHQGIPNGLVEGDLVPQIEKGKHGEDVASEKGRVPADKATAQKIIELLTEIKSTTLVDPQSSENFHPCPWCSGQLKNV